MIKKFFLGALLFLFVGLFSFLFLDNNIHVVIPHAIYRSSQLTPGSLSYLIQSKGIKSVINLRGEHTNEAWYTDEAAVTHQLGIPQYDLNWHAYAITPAVELQHLVQILESAPRPILIHCQGGSDRTGLASAIALILDDKNVDLATAEQQFSAFYFVIHSDSTAKLSFPYYTNWLREHHLQSSRENFILWVNQLQPGVNYPA